MSVLRLRPGCMGRKWLHQHGLLDHPGNQIHPVQLPHEYSARHIIGMYRGLRKGGVYDFQARSAVNTMIGACLSLDAQYGQLVTA